VGALKGSRGGHQEGSEALLSQVSAVRPFSVHKNGGEVGPFKPSRSPRPDFECCVVQRCPLKCEGSAEGALRAVRPKRGGCGPQGNLGSAAAARKAASASWEVVTRRLKPPKRKGGVS
jgi:hypothetical protein